MMLVFSFALVAAKAQTEEMKVKATTTPVQKVHNMIHRRKHHKGYKLKHMDVDGDKTKTMVNERRGTVEVRRN